MAHGSASGDGCSELGVPFPDGENGTPQSSLQPQPKQLRHHSAAPPQPQLQPQPRPHSYPHSYPELGVPFPVETELFEGHALLRTRSTPGCEEYDEGLKALSARVVRASPNHAEANQMRAHVLSGQCVAWEAGPRSAAELREAATHFDRAAALCPAPVAKAAYAGDAASCRRLAQAI